MEERPLFLPLRAAEVLDEGEERYVRPSMTKQKSTRLQESTLATIKS